MPESMEITIIDVNMAAPDASNMFTAPFVVTARSNVGEAPRLIAVTNVEKLLTKMKIKNVKTEIRIDITTYLGFRKTL